MRRAALQTLALLATCHEGAALVRCLAASCASMSHLSALLPSLARQPLFK
jgi:hypothetical protein